METGDVSACAPMEGGRIVEGSGLCFADATAGLSLLHGIMRWSILNEVDRGYVLHDSRNWVVRKLHTETLAFTYLPDEKVIFSSFKRKRSLEPVEWRVATGDRASFREALRRLESAGAAQLPIREMSEQGAHDEALPLAA
jgi:hypothetical protein